ncbi:hypothetical protein EIP86_006916 [Pleurotus ostreatoroseus]|nr:hypothetical protein EIP86_006916 [Pleurotus ostreatoroseus]
MTSRRIVLPTLSNWAEQHITALFKTTDEQTFDELFDNTFLKDAKIIVNGHHLSREQYRKQLLSAKGLEEGAQVAYTGAVEVPDNADQPDDSGNVGLFLQATIDEKFLVLGAPESFTVTASYNLTIVQDPSAPKPPKGTVGGDYDSRRISVLSKVTVDKRNPIVFPGGLGPAVPSQGSSA